ncbi:Asp/Glu/hydantoin racemase [filamentous cyanobacterium CCP3]|nr:Asp/Glu/hydantoin racemase [filamentous cyanobacterium CCP3]
MGQHIRLGMLTPSSNTVLEPITQAMVVGLPGVSAHFSRFRVTEISLDLPALGQFENTALVEAAQLLADAKVDVIAWNGTSAGWLGFEQDHELCRQITAATGIPATTSVLALQEIFLAQNITQFGLATPYTHDVQTKVTENFAQQGFQCIAEQHLSLRVNYSFAEVDAEKISAMVYQLARAQPQAITTFCTNLRAAPLVAELENDIGIPIFDTVTVAVWKSLRLAGVDTTLVKGWGSLFANLP